MLSAMLHTRGYHHVGISTAVYPPEKDRPDLFATLTLSGHRSQYGQNEACVGVYVHDPDLLTRISDAALKLRGELIAAQEAAREAVEREEAARRAEAYRNLPDEAQTADR